MFQRRDFEISLECLVFFYHEKMKQFYGISKDMVVNAIVLVLIGFQDVLSTLSRVPKNRFLSFLPFLLKRHYSYTTMLLMTKS